MSDRVVRIIITGDSAGAIKAMKDTEVAADSFGAKTQKLGKGVTSVGRSLMAFSLPLLAVGGYATDSAVKFQSAMKLIQTQTRASASEVARQSKGILGMAGKVGASPLELAEGLYPIESVGLRGAKAHKALQAAAEGAAVGHDTLAATSNAVAAAMKVQLKGVHSAGQAMGSFDAIVGHGKMVLEELTEAMGSGIMSTAKKAGIGIRGLGAALDVMTSRGVPATQAATRLRTDLIRTLSPSAEAIKALKQIGLGQRQLAEEMEGRKGLVGAMATLRGHLHGLSKPVQNQLLAQMFGQSKGASTMMELVGGVSEMQKLQPKLLSHLRENMAHTRESAAFKLKAALDTLRASLVRLGGVLIPVIVPALVRLAGVGASVARGFSKLPAPLRDVGLGLTGVLAVAGPLLITVGKLISAVGAMANAFKAISGVMDASALLNPWVLGFVALAAIVLIVATHFKQFKAIVSSVLTWLRTAIGNVIAFVKAHWPLLLGIIAGPFGLAVGFIATHLKQIGKIVTTVFNGIASFVTKVFDSIVNGVIRSLDFVIKIINTIIKGYNAIPGILRPTGAIKEVGEIKEIGAGVTHKVTRALGARPAYAGAAGFDHAQPLALNNQIYFDRRRAGRPMAETVTEYALRRKAREG